MSGTITFPPNPTDGQLYTSGGVTWQWHANPGVWVNANTGNNFLAIAGGTMTGPITLSGNAATALQATPLQQVNAVVAPAFNDVGRNVVLNGLFNIQQRGQGTWSADSLFTADLWKTGVLLDSISFGIGNLTDTDRAGIGDESATATLYNIFTGNAGATAYNFIQQSIEKVQRLSGKTCILSFWARAASGTPRLGINGVQVFGTGGSPSAALNVLATGLSVTLSATWTRYSVSIPYPSTAGKTLGTNGNDCSMIRIFYSAGANSNAVAGNIGVQSGTIYLWGVQLEIAQSGQTLPTPLDYGGSPQQQLAQCQRFYQLGTFYGQTNLPAATAIYTISSNYPVWMRATPTLSLVGSNNSVSLTSFSMIPVGAYMAYASGSIVTGGNQTTLSANFSASADL